MWKKCLGGLSALLLAQAVAAAEFTLVSPEIAPDSTLTDAFVYQGFGCEGDNRSPVLKWSGTPKGTKSFAVTVYDPDAPTGSGWWHWLVYNIPAPETELPANAGEEGGAGLPAGALHVRNDYGSYAFGGACPPVGDKPHRYIFTVHALGLEKLELPEDASAALLGFMINANRLGQATFTATYGR
ncbi:YbhB/YbcL family Raf kinase inhibitor-like protein [Pseudomaricurvus sp. HS19]|uniref:YbhB/YbcL family Raf kinase inhibitor-like protein n=1 Tax=Pseudomaricurvus sp. HS19 TaxID=2692626 RepID=UPI001371F638|nr:YbhB/YbcL family Raf kinase inhibitor-like protein [Pseudomaricurvus sp. HS19]MYM62731.1 YbhB/YbcL family Raf kinase inhibitor-like protein [Pseudomaricurvus sp. HS19]